MRSLAPCLLAASLTALSPAHAGEPEAQLGWGLEFGGGSSSVAPIYRLGIAVGDLTLLRREHRSSAADAPEEPGTVEPSSGSSWVPWVVGGVVAVVAIGVNLAEDRSEGCIGCVEDGRNGTQVSGVEDDGVACVNGVCAACPPGDVASECDGLVARTMRGESEIDVERQRWLDAGTGHMGDLFAR